MTERSSLELESGSWTCSISKNEKKKGKKLISGIETLSAEATDLYLLVKIFPIAYSSQSDVFVKAVSP